MTLRLLDLTVAYGERSALGPVSLDVGAGTWAGLIGPNGAGKSSLLRAVAGLVDSGGELSFAGTPVDARRAALVAYLPQRPELPPTMLVGDYILLGRSPHIAFFGRESHTDRTHAEAVAARLGLRPHLPRRLGELSGGEAQRVVLARALAQDAPLLLLDEPTAALDVGQAQRVLELVDELRLERGLTVVSAMHDLSLIGQFASSLCLLDAGRLVAHGPPGEVLSEEAVARHYGATIRRVEGPGAGPLLVPVRRATLDSAAGGAAELDAV